MKLKKILSCAVLCAFPLSGGFAQGEGELADEHYQDFVAAVEKQVDSQLMKSGRFNLMCFSEALQYDQKLRQSLSSNNDINIHEIKEYCSGFSPFYTISTSNVDDMKLFFEKELQVVSCEVINKSRPDEYCINSAKPTNGEIEGYHISFNVDKTPISTSQISFNELSRNDDKNQCYSNRVIGFEAQKSKGYFLSNIQNAIENFNAEYGNVNLNCYYNGKTKVFTDFEHRMIKDRFELGETYIYNNLDEKVFDQYFVSASGIDDAYRLVRHVSTLLPSVNWDCSVSSQGLRGDMCFVSGTNSPGDSVPQVAFWATNWDPGQNLFVEQELNAKIVSHDNVSVGCFHIKYKNDDHYPDPVVMKQNGG